MRIVAATNADVSDAGAKPFLREFLDRLRMSVVEAPALADRREDIPFLLETFATASVETKRRPDATIR